MLCLSLTPGEYLTVGEDVVLQLDHLSSGHCKLLIHAPREIPIVRGTALERRGGERPACVTDRPHWHCTQLPWDRSRAQALNAMRKVLGAMDSRDRNVRDLRRQLDHIFPPGEGTEART